MRLEGLHRLKNPLILQKIEPASFRPEAQCFNQLDCLLKYTYGVRCPLRHLFIFFSPGQLHFLYLSMLLKRRVRLNDSDSTRLTLNTCEVVSAGVCVGGTSRVTAVVPRRWDHVVGAVQLSFFFWFSQSISLREEWQSSKISPNFSSMHKVHLLLLFRKQCRHLYLDSGQYMYHMPKFYKLQVLF